MHQTIAITNQKGGVGKTTTAVSLAACLGAMGYPTLLVDMDPQANATSACGLDANNLEATIYEVLIENAPPPVFNLSDTYRELSILPSSMDLAGAEIELMDRENRETALRTILQSIGPSYDFVIIDSPPSLSLLTINVLVAADWVIVPVQAEYLALEGLTHVIRTLQRIRANYNPDLKLLGILPTLFDGRTNLANQVLEEIRKAFPDKLFPLQITRSIRLSEAPSFGQPIIYYDKRSPGAEQYFKLCEEVLDACEKTSIGPRS